MKTSRCSITTVLALLLAGAAAYANTASPFHVANRIRFEFDDNVYQTDRNEEDSFNIYEEIELSLNLNFENTFLGLRYRPNLVWYSGRDDGETDFLNDLDLNFSQKFGPAFTLGISEKLRAGQLPAVEDGDYRVRSDEDNIYNSVLATLACQILPATRLDLSARHIILEYDDASHNNDNYRIIIGGLSLRQTFGSLSTLSLDARYEDSEYNDADPRFRRDASTIYAGLGLEQTLNPALLGSLRAGVSVRDFDLEGYDDHTDPYVDFSLSFFPSPATRLTANLGYAIGESDASAYLTETRFNASLHLAHDFTAKLTLATSVGYSHGEFESDYSFSAARGASISDEDDDRYYATALLSFQILRNNWLEFGWQYLKIDADNSVETPYDRNRLNLGWRIQLF